MSDKDKKSAEEKKPMSLESLEAERRLAKLKAETPDQLAAINAEFDKKKLELGK